MSTLRIFLLPFIALLLITCSDNSTNTESDPETEDPDPNPTAELDCERLGYPCSLADVPEEIYNATYNALQEAYDVRADGTMEDVRMYLEGLPDMASVLGDERSISFRFEGGSPAIFVDKSGTISSESKYSGRSLMTESVNFSNSVVGEDQNGDDKVNNQDQRRGLLLGPMNWAYGTLELVGPAFSGISEYQEHLSFILHADISDEIITIENYSSWMSYDLIYLITEGGNVCYEGDECTFALTSGLPVSKNDPASNMTGIILMDLYLENIVDEGALLGLTPDFFREAYKEKLDNTLLILGGTETGSSGANQLANVLAGENFAMIGWKDIVNSPEGDEEAANNHRNAYLRLQELLADGLSSKNAVTKVENSSFEHFSPNSGDQRIREVIQLVDLGGPLQDGEGIIAERNNGTDHLNLVAVVDGVIPEEKSDYSIRVELNGEEIGETYNLADAQKAPDYGDYSYIVELEDIDTGQTLPSGELLELEAIVDLPEGGESRFEVMVQVASCYFNAFITGDFSGTFEGPARLRFGIGESEGSVGVDLQSTAYVNGEMTPDNFTAATGFMADTDDEGNISPGEYTITGGNALQYDVFSSSYIPGFEDADCSQCGGTFTVDSFDEIEDEEFSMTGSFDVTMPVNEPRPNPDNPFIITLSGSFTAVTGQISDFNSPFTQCQITYAED